MGHPAKLLGTAEAVTGQNRDQSQKQAGRSARSTRTRAKATGFGVRDKQVSHRAWGPVRNDIL